MDDFWATVAKIAKKVLTWLLGSKKGRKFLGYTIGIAVFIVLLPVIAVYGLFGWMAGPGASTVVDYNTVYNAMPQEYRETMEQYETELNQITVTFIDNGISSADISKAKAIFISCLTGKEAEDGFYQTYADCFKNQTEEADALQNISSAFGIEFSDADREKLNQLYGGTS